MATEKTSTNEALTQNERDILAEILFFYRATIAPDIEMKLAIDDIDALLAKRPASYTVEQIRAAASKAHWEDGGEEIIAILSPHGRCWLPKTPEERVTVVAGTEGGYFTLYKIDGKIVQDAEVVKALVSALKESEAHNG